MPPHLMVAVPVFFRKLFEPVMAISASTVSVPAFSKVRPSLAALWLANLSPVKGLPDTEPFVRVALEPSPTFSAFRPRSSPPVMVSVLLSFSSMAVPPLLPSSAVHAATVVPLRLTFVFSAEISTREKYFGSTPYCTLPSVRFSVPPVRTAKPCEFTHQVPPLTFTVPVPVRKGAVVFVTVLVPSLKLTVPPSLSIQESARFLYG